MEKQPLVSIITPCYNSENYIQRYIDSIQKQTYKNIELIFVNDGSTDRTEEILNKNKEVIENAGMKFVYIDQKNKGLGGAINTGLKYITGEYFAWCDSDNFYSEDYVKENVDFFLRKPECNILRCGGNIVEEGNINKIIGILGDGEKEKNIKNLFYNAILEKDFHFGCVMLRTSAFDKINPSREIYESREGQNWQLLLPMLYHYDAYYIDKRMFTFVYRKDSVSNVTKQKGIEDKLKQIEEYKKILTTTIKGMNIPEEKRCLDMIEEKYNHVTLQIAKEYKNKELLEKQYQILKKNKILNKRDRIIYITAKNKLIDKLFNKYVEVRSKNVNRNG